MTVPDPAAAAPCPAEDADPALPDVPAPIGATDECGRPAGRVRRVLRAVLPLAIGAALVAVVISSGSSVTAASRALRHMDRSWIAAALAAEAASYLWLSLHLRLLAGNAPNARRAAPLRVALVVFGLGNVMPAAPAEGLVMANAALKRRRVDPRRIAVMLGFSQWFSTRALFAVASIDALVAVTVGDVPLPYRGGVLGAAAVTLAALGLTAWLSTRRRVAEAVASAVLRVVHWRHCPPASERRARGAAWHAVAAHVAGERRQRVALTATTAAAWVSDGMCMYLALRAAGVHVGVDQLLLAYTAGVIASNVPLIPAGLGIVETVTPWLLVRAGVRWPEAIAAVLVYRLLGTLLPALAGLLATAGLRIEADAADAADPAPAAGVLGAASDALSVAVGIAVPSAPRPSGPPGLPL